MKAWHGSAMCFKCGCHVSPILTPEVAVLKGWHCPCAIDSPSHPISHHCTPGVHLQCWWSIWLCTHPVWLFSINRCHPINWITSLISTQEPKYKVLYVTVQWRCNCVWCCVDEIDLTFWYHHVVMIYALKNGCDCLTMCWLHFNFSIFWPSSQCVGRT